MNHTMLFVISRGNDKKQLKQFVNHPTTYSTMRRTSDNKPFAKICLVDLKHTRTTLQILQHQIRICKEGCFGLCFGFSCAPLPKRKKSLCLMTRHKVSFVFFTPSTLRKYYLSQLDGQFHDIRAKKPDNSAQFSFREGWVCKM